jgi:hypothetical protein
MWLSYGASAELGRTVEGSYTDTRAPDFLEAHIPMPHQDIGAEIESYRHHFDAMYVGGIPNLLNDSGAFLSFLAVLAGTEALAGLYRPSLATGERFREF